MPETVLRCPDCGYELGAASSDAGVCPECGHAYSRARLAARREVLIGLAVAFVGWGGLAKFFAGTLGGALSHTSRASDGSGGDGGQSQDLLTLAPLTVFVCGLVMLASLVGRQLRWTVTFVAVVLWISALSVAANRGWGGDLNLAWWLQLSDWRFPGRWALPLATYGATVCVCVLLPRIAADAGWKPARRACLHCRWLACVAAAILVYSRYVEYSQIEAMNQWSSVAAGTPPYFQTYAFVQTVKHLESMMSDGVWLVMTMTALLVSLLRWRERGVAET